MDMDVFLILITIIWVIFASITDLKKREVPDWLSYSLIIIGIIFSLINSIIKSNFFLLIKPLIGFITFFIIGNLMYYSKQWGGGDAKLLMSFGIIFASYPEFLLNYFGPNLELPFTLILLINIIVIGALYGIIWSIYLSINNKQKFLKEFKFLLEKNKKGRYIITISTILLIILSLFLERELRLFTISLASLLFVFFYTSLFIRSVENSCMFKKLEVEKLTEGDWVTEKVIIDGKLIYSPRNIGVTKEDIISLNKLKSRIKYVTIKEGIPFVPSFLIAIIVSLIFGSPINFP